MSPNDSLYEFLAGHFRTHSIRSCLEIGTREGDSLRVVVENSPELSRIVCCDTWGNQYGGSGRGSDDHIHRMLAQLLYVGNVACLTGDSKQTVPLLKGPFDLVLVDGDHSFAGATADLENVWPLVSRGGCVVFHDTNHPAHMDLAQCFNEFVARHNAPHQFITEGFGLGVAWKQ
jgi:predicted O-methyltransferase YrrM